ncbi:MAG: hypothetical protein LBH34_01890 [Prevotellaceae bacterium]|jgi:hypothetical protein|nr:hypothetical protein [Prevotellaceae bacterium]
MRNIITILIITILTYSSGFAQSDFALAQAPSPTPTAHELGKYGNIPISHHTGTAQISIPIYNLEIADMSLPITLDYHSSGIKVDDIASWVGLGWGS